jgi:hypothetical protein
LSVSEKDVIFIIVYVFTLLVNAASVEKGVDASKSVRLL